MCVNNSNNYRVYGKHLAMAGLVPAQLVPYLSDVVLGGSQEFHPAFPLWNGKIHHKWGKPWLIMVNNGESMDNIWIIDDISG